jgi:hypothetical protein
MAWVFQIQRLRMRFSTGSSINPTGLKGESIRKRHGQKLLETVSLATAPE